MKRTALALMLIAAVSTHTPTSAAVSYIETFDTQTYAQAIDPGLVWDTSAGQLRLEPRQMTLHGELPGLSGNVVQTVVRGNTAYLVAEAGGMHAVDIANPAAPTLLGTYAGYIVLDLDVDGDLAVLGSNSGFRLVDVSNPAAPVQLYDQVGDYAGGVEIIGNRLYLSLNDSLRILDISDPTTPVWMGSVPLGGGPYRIEIQGRYAYMPRQANLSIVDISDPTNPTVVAVDATESSFVDAVIDGDYLYASIVDTGVRCYDVSNPAAPVILSTYSPGNYIFGLALSGNALFVAWRDDGVIQLDLTDPANMVEVSTLDTPGYADGVAVSGRYTYVADSNRLTVIENASTLVTGFGQFQANSAVNSVQVQGDYMYTSTVGVGLQVVSMTPAYDPKLVSTRPLFGTRAIAVSGDYAYVANGGFGFSIVDISNPASTSIVFTQSAGLFDTYQDVKVDGHLAYIVISSLSFQTLHIWDVSDPTAPAQLGVYSGIGLNGLDVEGGLAVVTSLSNLEILDVRDPANIIVLSSTFPPSGITTMEIEGDVLYAAGGTSLLAYDISDPTSPALLDTYVLSGNALDISVEGNMAWLATSTRVFQGVNVSDPTSMSGTTSWAGEGASVVARGDLVYAADAAGVQVWKTMNRRFETTTASAKSTNINPTTDAVAAIRAIWTSPPTIWSFLSVDGGGSYAEPDSAEWVYFTTPGADVIWNMYLVGAQPETNPTLDDLTIEMLFEFGHIEAIADVGNDQGRNARLTWARSGYDHIGSPNPIMSYDVYRQQVPGLAPSAAAHPAGTMAAQLAGWDYVTSVPAAADDEYSIVVPTLADSTDVSGIVYSTFMVRAVTGAIGVHYDSHPDSGYSVDNLAPLVPANPFANYSTGSGNQLSWDPPVDEDFQYFRVYRDTDPSFTPAPGNLVDATTANGWTDPTYDTGGVFYKISAVDFAGNESDYAAPNGPTVGIENGGLPTTLRFYPSAPNPFRASTALRFALPTDSRVELSVYDVTGRRVRTLASGTFDAGIHTIRWNGRDNAGRALPPGLYLTRFVVNEHVRTGRLVRVE